MESVSTSKDGDHSHHSRPVVGFLDDHMALEEADMDPHNGEEEGVLERRTGRHTGGVEVEDNHQCAGEEGCDAHTHCDHSSHDGVEVSAPDNGLEGCIRAVGPVCRNHPWEDTHGGVNGTGKDRA